MFVRSTRDAIAELVQAGLTAPAIARRLNLAPTTVSYHVARLSASGQVAANDDQGSPEPEASTVATRRLVEELLAVGHTRAEVARLLGIAKATVSYHARRLGESIDNRCARRYDWEAVQRYYDQGHGVRACMSAFGFSSASWFEAVKRGSVIARPAATPIDELLVADTYRGRYYLKLRLLRAGLKHDRCEQCGIEDWCGRPITLALHHVNGIRDDNRLQNLQLLCPNCHSQTSTYAGRNGRSTAAVGSPPTDPLSTEGGAFSSSSGDEYPPTPLR